MAARVTADEWVREVVARHFDPDAGSAFWLEKERSLQIDARTRVRGVADLRLLGPFDESELHRRSIFDFVPRSLHQHLPGAIIAETAGTTAAPKRTLFLPDEFHAAFVEPFVVAASLACFPRGGAWLFAGPSGPHVIGPAAAACAHALGAPQPFTIDFDPRWFRRLPADSTIRERYLQHLVDQAATLLECEPITVLFTTPPLLTRLAGRMSAQQREAIRGVHYGGMRVERDLLRRAQVEWFPNAVHLAGYGNSLFGLCMEMGGAADRELRYFPHGSRQLVQIGDDGRVWMSRLDRSFLIANLRERDVAEPAAPPAPLAAAGFESGVVDPRPAEDSITVAKCGIY